jgi:hypothetical protein
MAKGAEKCSPCMLSRHVVHLGILKWMRMRESSPSILKLDKSLSHLRIDGWKCLKNKISKTKETAEWNCSVCKIDVHLYVYKYSFFSRTIRDWNQLSDELLDIDWAVRNLRADSLSFTTNLNNMNKRWWFYPDFNHL